MNKDSNKMYLVKLTKATVYEVNRLLNMLKINVWEGVIFPTRAQGNILATACYSIEPGVEVEITQLTKKEKSTNENPG